MDNNISINPGDKIYLEPATNVYSGKYISEVIEINNNHIVISVPFDKGKLIPLAVGTKLKVSNSSFSFDSEVLSRKLGNDKNLEIARPGSIFRGQRDNMTDNKSARVIAVTSGKGGVGKSSLSINIAISMARLGQRACVVDADLGMANVDVLLNLSPKYNLTHLIMGYKDIFDIVLEGPEGILIIPGGSGWQEIANLRDSQFSKLLQAFNKLDDYADVILLDTGAGVNKNVINFLLASDEVLLVTTPEPHAITDAYAMIKIIMRESPELPIRLIVNKVDDKREGDYVGEKIVMASKQFLGASVKYLGHVMDNTTFSQSIKKQKPIMIEWPRSKTAQEIEMISNEILGRENPDNQGLKGFIKKLSGFLAKK
ncbi:AAA family ATPase [Natranaerofaba carboxydovora]|uniref:AAA family ATPase n=1 Tax=Natranaerofaba carboxydovora TaxID=2742683 RepID=UPI001F1450A9|nr:AAA family ATPase [Natranaerofaba carboxydovora]UMZ74499.1 Flagellum site-determining protein YlxH [Natranaerofaba carboxydovora]